ncbi:MAG TPA: ABC transporter permease [Phycisphaerae bacterium]|jgi:simple sugar transport system permease protein|nr:ABC transporter permease [Phycisphaerae bacterium]
MTFPGPATPPPPPPQPPLPSQTTPALAGDARASLLRRLRSFPLLWPIVALLVLLLVDLIHSPAFFHIRLINTAAAGQPAHWQFFGSPIDILNRGAPVMLMALGMALVIGTGGIDLSVGAVMAISGAIAAAMLVPDQTAFIGMAPKGTAAAIVLGLLLAGIAGVWNGVLVAIFRVQPIVATLVLMVAGRGVAQLITRDLQPAIPAGTWPAFAYLGRGTLFWLPVPVTVVIVVSIATILITRLTALGLFIESIGNNPVASAYAGVPARLVTVLAYTFSGLCAGLAGLIQCSNVMSADPNKTGLNRELDAILAVAVGGTALTGGRFSLIGALLGALIMQTLDTTILTSSLPSETTMVVEALVVIAICLLQSERLRAYVLSGLGAIRGLVTG